MRKFLSLLLTLCLTFSLGIALVGCDPQDPPPEPPASYSSLTETEWSAMLANSPKNNVKVVESLGPGNFAEFWITSSQIEYNPDGITPSSETGYANVNLVINAFGFYQNIAFADLTFNDTNDTYSYAGPITVEIPVLDNYSEDGVQSYTYTNIVIKLGVNDYDEKVIETITAYRTKNYADSSNNTSSNVTLTYSQFGELSE